TTRRTAVMLFLILLTAEGPTILLASNARRFQIHTAGNQTMQWGLAFRNRASARHHSLRTSANMPSRPFRPAQTGSAATQLVECTVRVSPALARIVRKIAEREASGVSTIDALLDAVGLQRGELESLRKKLELVSGEAKQWREKAEHEHAQIEHLKG